MVCDGAATKRPLQPIISILSRPSNMIIISCALVRQPDVPHLIFPGDERKMGDDRGYCPVMLEAGSVAGRSLL